LAKKGAAEFLDLIDNLQELAKTKSISDLVKEILERSGLAALYRKDGDEDRLENIKELVSSMLLLEKENKEPINVEEYLQEIALFTDLDTHNENQDKVKLMTIHISKGLEFPYVFLCGFTEGVLPSALSIKERRSRAIEEERRLTYVAVTRAEKRFYITDSEGYNFTTGLQKYPSRFLFEISEEFYIRKGKLSPEILQASQVPVRNLGAENKELFAVGDLVLHEVFKKGRIKAVNPDKNQYTIDFFEISKEKPIDFNFRFLQKISDNTISGSNANSDADSAIDLKSHLKSQENPFDKNDNAWPDPFSETLSEDEKAVPSKEFTENDTDTSRNKDKKWWKF
jgi:DNA helicase II / ATP-dependent DNA helicase PcrA